MPKNNVIPVAPILSGNGDGLRDKIRAVLAELRDEYLAPHSHPWIIGFSGGKDSTLVAHFAFETLLDIAPSDRRREVHIVSNDTLVESPVLMKHIDNNLARIQAAAVNLGLPVKAEKTKPEPAQTFWVNLIGRGYPSPNQNFRWCTDRMKIQPTSNYIRQQAAETGTTILLLGVREQESAARATITRRYSNGERLHPHGKLKGCLVFRPILDFTTEEVWLTLLQRKQAPWGEKYRDLITLYRNAEGGECPTVTDTSEAAACGTSSARFGCWTCTVVNKDRSLTGMIAAGFEHLEPLMDFRDWLSSIRNDPKRRMAVRRNGRVQLKSNGGLVYGPFTLEARRDILEKLKETENSVGRRLVSDDEVGLIRQIWADDAIRILAGRMAGTEELQVA